MRADKRNRARRADDGYDRLAAVLRVIWRLEREGWPDMSDAERARFGRDPLDAAVRKVMGVRRK